MPLVMTPGQARTVIEYSENLPGHGGGHAGHTKAMHVEISRLALAERMEQPDPDGRYHGKIFWRAAFLDIHSCAELLSQAITSLGGQPFVRDFDLRDDGTMFPSVPDEFAADPARRIRLPGPEGAGQGASCQAVHAKVPRAPAQPSPDYVLPVHRRGLAPGDRREGGLLRAPRGGAGSRRRRRGDLLGPGARHLLARAVAMLGQHDAGAEALGGTALCLWRVDRHGEV